MTWLLTALLSLSLAATMTTAQGERNCSVQEQGEVFFKSGLTVDPCGSGLQTANTASTATSAQLVVALATACTNECAGIFVPALYCNCSAANANFVRSFCTQSDDTGITYCLELLASDRQGLLANVTSECDISTACTEQCSVELQSVVEEVGCCLLDRPEIPPLLANCSLPALTACDNTIPLPTPQDCTGGDIGNITTPTFAVTTMTPISTDNVTTATVDDDCSGENPDPELCGAVGLSATVTMVAFLIIVTAYILA